MTADQPVCTVRRSPRDEGEARRAVIRETWHAAYAGIFSRQEMSDVFSGRTQTASAWSARRTESWSLVAEADDAIVGVIALSILDDGTGEVVALYVLPEWQGKGVGLALWDAGLDDLRARGCIEAHVWTLAKSRSVTFYEARGCARFAEGTFFVGEHGETSYGYRLALE